MKVVNQLSDVASLLKQGRVGVIPTDTIYGLVGSALDSEVVEKIYNLRKRAKDKPMITLIANLNDLYQFDVQLNDEQKKFLEKIWPNPVSVVLSCSSEKFKYLHRGKDSLAFRMPNNKKLLEVLKQTGPLVAPSANFEGEPPAGKIDQAKKYFGENVSFYLDGGEIKSQPSTIISLNIHGDVTMLRQGIFRV